MQLPPLSGSGIAHADKWSAWIDFGSLPDLIAGLAAAGALYAAIRAGKYAKGSFEQQRDQIAALEKDKRKDQASQIAAWVDRSHTAGNSYVVANNSSLPVHAMYVWVLPVRSEDQNYVGGKQEITLLPPGEHSFPCAVKVPGYYAVGMVFIDHAGAAWVRWGASELTEIPDRKFMSIIDQIPCDDFVELDMAELKSKLFRS